MQRHKPSQAHNMDCLGMTGHLWSRNKTCDQPADPLQFLIFIGCRVLLIASISGHRQAWQAQDKDFSDGWQWVEALVIPLPSWLLHSRQAS